MPAPYDPVLVRAMDAALAAARDALAAGELPYGAVVVDAAGAVIASAHDRVVAHADLTSHAELLAVRSAAAAAGPDLGGCTLVSTVEPCAMCFSAAWTAGVSRVAFGLAMAELRDLVPTSMDEIVIDSRRLNALAQRRLAIVVGVGRDACLELWTPLR